MESNPGRATGNQIADAIIEVFFVLGVARRTPCVGIQKRRSRGRRRRRRKRRRRRGGRRRRW